MEEAMETSPEHNADRHIMAEVYRMAVEGDSKLLEFLSQHGLTTGSAITIDVLSDCRCVDMYEKQTGPHSSYSLTEAKAYVLRGCCLCLDNSNNREDTERVSVTPLHVTLRHKNLSLFKSLITVSSVESLNLQTSPSFFSLLHLVLGRFDINEVDMLELLGCLVSAGANVDLTDESDIAPLHLAMTFEYLSVLKLLVDAGAKLDVCTCDGETALLMAVRANSSVEKVKILVEAGCDVNIEDNHGRTPLITAVHRRNIEVVRLLVKGNCNINKTRSGKNEYVLHYSVSQGNKDMTDLLLAAGADPNITHKDVSFYYPIMFAAQENFLEIGKALVGAGADPNLKNDHGYSAIHLAAWEGHVEFVKFLLGLNCAHDERTLDKNTPVALACHGDHYEVVRILLPYGCNVNNADKDDDTALHYAAYNRCAKSVKLLLEHGANPRVQNSVQATGLWNAIEMESWEVANLLIQENVELDIPSRGIDQHARTDFAIMLYDKPRTPFHVAMKRRWYYAARMLLIAGVCAQKEDWWRDWCAIEWDVSDSEMKMIDSVIKYATNARPLKSACRLFIRNYFRNREINIRMISKLEIPHTLVDFILMKDNHFDDT